MIMNFNFKNHDGTQHFIKKGYMLQDRNEKDYHTSDYCLVRSVYNHIPPVVDSQGYDTGADPSRDYGSSYPQKVGFGTVFTQPYTHELGDIMESDALYADGMRIDYYEGTLTFYIFGYFNDGSKGREVPLFQYEWAYIDSDSHGAETFDAEKSEYGMICNCGNTSGWIVRSFTSPGQAPEGFFNTVYHIECPSCREYVITYQRNDSPKSPFKKNAETFNADVKMDNRAWVSYYDCNFMNVRPENPENITGDSKMVSFRDYRKELYGVYLTTQEAKKAFNLLKGSLLGHGDWKDGQYEQVIYGYKQIYGGSKTIPVEMKFEYVPIRRFGYDTAMHTKTKNAEYNVEFNEWADQELMSHGKDISFKDWAQDEGMKHGNTEITEWAQHEDESHNARYGAEEHRFMIACGRCGWNFTDKYIKNNTDGNIRPMYGDHCSCGGMVKRYDFEPEAKPKGFFKKLFGKNAETFDDSFITTDMNYNAEGKKRKKRSDLLSEPFEGTSLDSGEWKGILTGIGLFGLVFGFSKLRK